MYKTGVPFDAREFVAALKMIYKHTHPPDETKGAQSHKS